MKPRVAIIVQARMASTRLPGKVMLPIMGRPMLEFLYERLKHVQLANHVVFVVPHYDAAIAWQINAPYGTGDHDTDNDVLRRYYRVVSGFWQVYPTPDIIVRVTADCPLIDPATIDASIAYLVSGGYDHVAPDGLPDGMGCDVFTRELLETMHREATLPEDREHVTLYALKRPDRFNLGKLWYLPDNSFMRWTVDYQEDYEKVRAIYEGLYPSNPTFGYPDILAFLGEHPEIATLNANRANVYSPADRGKPPTPPEQRA